MKPCRDAAENRPISGAPSDERDGMHRSSLSDAIDTADPLFEADRIPRHVEVHDETAGMVQVQPLARRIRRKKHPG
jgi:hypothetical protein